jgi:hypothetical protein
MTSRVRHHADCLEYLKTGIPLYIKKDLCVPVTQSTDHKKAKCKHSYSITVARNILWKFLIQQEFHGHLGEVYIATIRFKSFSL